MTPEDKKTYESHDESVAVRTNRLLERLAKGCDRCSPRSVSECKSCVCSTAKDIIKTMRDSRFSLGVIDLNTGAIECRDTSKSHREGLIRSREKQRQRVRELRAKTAAIKAAAASLPQVAVKVVEVDADGNEVKESA